MFLFMFWYSEAIQCLLQVLSMIVSVIINCMTTGHIKTHNSESRGQEEPATTE